MRIFGIYGGYLNHDPGVCLVEDGEIVFCWNEERPRRLKPSDIDTLNWRSIFLLLKSLMYLSILNFTSLDLSERLFKFLSLRQLSHRF